MMKVLFFPLKLAVKTAAVIGAAMILCVTGVPFAGKK